MNCDAIRDLIRNLFPRAKEVDLCAEMQSTQRSELVRKALLGVS
jgi:hypothetical protein